jgi:hypothetical protein
MPVVLQVMTYLKSLFGPDIVNHVVVVFTHGDHVAGKDLRQFVEKAPPELQAILKV